jgi:hypothetical protein
MLSVSTSSLESLNYGDVGWAGRSFFGAASVNGILYVFGGVDEKNEYLNDVWDVTGGKRVSERAYWSPRASF